MPERLANNSASARPGAETETPSRQRHRAGPDRWSRTMEDPVYNDPAIATAFAQAQALLFKADYLVRFARHLWDGGWDSFLAAGQLLLTWKRIRVNHLAAQKAVASVRNRLAAAGNQVHLGPVHAACGHEAALEFVARVLQTLEGAVEMTRLDHLIPNPKAPKNPPEKDVGEEIDAAV